MADTKQAEKGQTKADQGKAAKKRTIADILAEKKPNTRTVDIILDSDLANEILLKEQEKEQLRSRKGRSLADGIGPIETELDALYEKAADTAVTFVFEDIGRKVFDALVLEHPPTKAQKEQIAELGGGILEYNIETFPPALIAAAASDPEMDLDDAVEIFDTWSSGDAEILFTVALLVCKERTSIPLSKNGTDPISDIS
jgi:hypothetical protein